MSRQLQCGAKEVSFMEQTGHRSSAMVHKYLRRVEAFLNSTAPAAGCDACSV